MVDAKMLIFTSVQNQQSLDSRALLFRTIYHSPLRILVRRCMHMSPQKLMLKQKSSLSDFDNRAKIKSAFIDKALNWSVLKSGGASAL